MKLLYTCINCLFNTNTINQEDCKRNISGSLKKVSSPSTCHEAITVFKQLLDKAKQDGIISDHKYYSFESDAVVTHVGAVPFVREIWKSIHNIQTRIVVLENRVDVLENRVDGLDSKVKTLEQKGIHRKQKIEGITGMMSAVINGLSFGIAGSLFQGAMGAVISDIVDF
eukprot:2811813-Ditylum_brightwellii.AAC.1